MNSEAQTKKNVNINFKMKCCTKVDVLVTLEQFFKEVKNSLEQGENVYVRGFGSFIVKKRAKKIGRNIQKNIAIEIPEHYIPAFNPSKEFTERVKNASLDNK